MFEGGLVVVLHCTELNSRRAKLNRESVVNLLQTDVRVFLMGGMLVKAWCKTVLRYQISKKTAWN